MSIVDDVAKIIDPVAFDGVAWEELIDGEYRPHRLAAGRKNLAQAKAVATAVQVIRLLARRPGLREDAVAVELSGWEARGLPFKGNADAEKIIRKKYEPQVGAK